MSGFLRAQRNPGFRSIEQIPANTGIAHLSI